LGDDGPTPGNGENVETKGLTWNLCSGSGGCGVGARETGVDDDGVVGLGLGSERARRYPLKAGSGTLSGNGFGSCSTQNSD